MTVPPNTEGITEMNSGVKGVNLVNNAKDNKKRKQPVSPIRPMAKGPFDKKPKKDPDAGVA